MDPIVQCVKDKLDTRSQRGIAKYGTDMTRKDLTHRQWLIHAQEEAMDLAIYLERVIQDTPIGTVTVSTKRGSESMGFSPPLPFEPKIP